MIRKLIVLFVFASIFAVLIVDLASAADLPALGELLTPAYTAMSLARLCETDPEWRASEPEGPRGNATNYAEYAKNEAIRSLTYNQSVSVLRFAANAAITEGRKQLHDRVTLGDKAEEDIRFKNWCHAYVKDFVANFIASFERNKNSFVLKLQQAKQAEEKQ
jgi:hypothetical protein